MLRKMKKMILLVLSVVAMTLSASAQHAVGDWRIHTSFVGDQVKSIAEQEGIKMPSFFGYMIKFSLIVCLPVYVIVQLIFI